jgi:hypothetical protein
MGKTLKMILKNTFESHRSPLEVSMDAAAGNIENFSIKCPDDDCQAMHHERKHWMVFECVCTRVRVCPCMGMMGMYAQRECIYCVVYYGYVQGFTRSLIVLSILDAVMDMRAEMQFINFEDIRPLVTSCSAVQCNYQVMDYETKLIEAMSASAGACCIFVMVLVLLCLGVSRLEFTPRFRVVSHVSRS